MRHSIALAVGLALAACSVPDEERVVVDAADAGTQPLRDAAIEDALADASVDAVVDAEASDVEELDGASDTGVEPDLSSACASVFGSGLTADFGRLDGTLSAAVAPDDLQCTTATLEHLVLEVAAQGGIYKVFINVRADGRNGTDTSVRYLELHRALVGVPFAEGWHPGAVLDYAATLDAHSTSGFGPLPMEALIAQVDSHLALGAPISVYATSELFVDSVHLVHENGPGIDGALVIAPSSADPLFLLFHFDGQVF